MKKQILMMFVAVLAVSFVSAGFAAPKKPVGKNVVLLKGLQLWSCEEIVKDSGFITVSALKNGVKMPLVKGKFDLTLPPNPEFCDDKDAVWNGRGNDIGKAKIYSFSQIHFRNTKKTGPDELDAAGGSVELRFINLYFSDSNVKVTIQGDEITLKKGWNIINRESDNLRIDLDCHCGGNGQ